MADAEDTFDAAQVMETIVRDKAPPPPQKGGLSRLAVFGMLAAVAAATDPGNRALRQAVAITIPREGSDASNRGLKVAMAPGGSLHNMIRPATQAGRALANAASDRRYFMFKRGQCPSMMHPDTVLLLIPAGYLIVAWTVCYVSGKVGCSSKYEEFNNGRLCKGWECFVDFHHVTTHAFHYGLCYIQSGFNRLIEKIVHPKPPSGLKNMHKANSPAECLDNLFKLKKWEDDVVAENAEGVLECQRDSREMPSKILLRSLMPGAINFIRLKKADSAHRKLAGVDARAKGIYQFKTGCRPDFVDGDTVLEVFTIMTNGDYKSKCTHIRVLHGRCPILGIGGTKVGGGSSGVAAKSKNWPVVLHHLEYKDSDDLSMVTLCHTVVNQAVGLIE